MTPAPRKIIHVDQDCFYAAVEVRDKPSLVGRPVAVGGSREGRGVLTTANYEARKFGIHSAMPTSQALKRCPDLVLLPVRFEKYRKESQVIRGLFQKLTPIVEPLSLDEAYLDVSHVTLFEGSATRMAQEIRKQIYETTGLTASAGIAPNKFLAKVASDWHKPNGQFTIAPADVSRFVAELPVTKIPGVGKVTAKKMTSLKIENCKDLQKFSISDLTHHFGSWGVRLYDLSRGKDDRAVQTDRSRKSLSVENTFSDDLVDLEACLAKVPELYKEFMFRYRKSLGPEQVKALVVKIKFTDFQQTTLERSQFKEPTLKIFLDMFEEAFLRENKPARLLGLGVRLNSLKKRATSSSQLGLF